MFFYYYKLNFSPVKYERGCCKMNVPQQPQIFQIVPQGHFNRPKGAISSDRRSDITAEGYITRRQANITEGTALISAPD